jgi:hypothetical protein
MEEPAKKKGIKDWPGLVTNKDEFDNPEAAVSCQNIRANVAGKLRPRKGLRVIQFGNQNTGTPGTIVSSIGMPAEFENRVVYQDVDGKIKVGKAPT